ncbi:hypothetical protein TURU_038813 [Turdus rufiventris]|nr:hypothetical protein TURU_038813 [Turdus rufiventris]
MIGASSTWCLVTPDIPKGSVLPGIFTDDLYKEIEGILNQFADDTKLGWNVVQKNVFWRMERLCRGIWTGWTNGPKPVVCFSTRPRTTSCPWVNSKPLHLHRLGTEWLERFLVQKGLGVLVNTS